MRLTQLMVVAAVMSVLALPASATSIALTGATQGGTGNKGASWRPAGADFVFTAEWGMFADGSNDPSQNPNNTAGFVYQDKNGVGVWADNYKWDKKKKVWKFDPGSNGISGGGPHGKEELIFTFDSPAVFDSVLVGLVDIEFGSLPNLGDDKDDPLFLMSLDGVNEIGVSEASLLGAFTSTGSKTGYVDFGLLAGPSFGPNAELAYFRTRELNKHYEVGCITYELSSQEDVPSGEIPEPATITLFGLGALGMTIRRIRRRKK